MQAFKINLGSHEETLRIHYMNSVGAIIDNSLMLYLNDKSLIDIKEIRKVELYKTRSLFYNMFFIFCSLPFFYALLMNEISTLEKFLVGILIIIFIALACIIENSSYVMLIRKLDLNFIEIKVSKNDKDEAKEITKIVNTRIKQLR